MISFKIRVIGLLGGYASSLVVILFLVNWSASGLSGAELYWTDSRLKTINRTPINTLEPEELVTSANGLSQSQGLVIDPIGRKMYFTDAFEGTVNRANLDGSNVEGLVTSGLSNPVGIAIDFLDRKLYFSDFSPGLILRSNLDGSNVEPIVQTGGDIGGVAVDSSGRHLYWTDSEFNKIQRSDLDGGNVVDLITTNLNFPRGIDLDIDGGKMYFSDSLRSGIRRANLDGSNDELIVGVVDSHDITRDLALDLVAGKIYWAENGPSNNKILRSNLDGTEVEEIYFAEFGSPRDVEIYRAEVIPEPWSIQVIAFISLVIFFSRGGGGIKRQRT